MQQQTVVNSFHTFFKFWPYISGLAGLDPSWLPVLAQGPSVCPPPDQILLTPTRRRDFLSQDLKTTVSSLPFPPPTAHHLAGVCQHSPLRASGSGRRLPEAFQTTGEGPLRGDRLWQHLLPAKQVSPQRPTWHESNPVACTSQHAPLLDANM